MNIQLLVFAPSQIETWPIDRLRPYARNAKIHGTDQVAKIAASMARTGLLHVQRVLTQKTFAFAASLIGQ
jgi:hypothetical protein